MILSAFRNLLQFSIGDDFMIVLDFNVLLTVNFELLQEIPIW